MTDFLDKFPSEISGALEQGFRNLTGTEKEFGKLDGAGKIGSNAGAPSGIYDYPEGIGESQNLNGHFIQFQAYQAEGLHGGHGTEGKEVHGGHDDHGTSHVRSNSVPSPGQIPGGTISRTSSILGIDSPKYTAKETIRLYMPESINAGYKATWDTGEVGLASSKALDLTGIGNTEDLAGTLGAYGKGVADVYTSLLNRETFTQAALDALTVLDKNETLKNTIHAKERRVRNPHLAFLFKGMGTRQFTFEFRFNPWNEREAKITKDIIKAFKRNMHPEIDSTTTSAVLGIFLKYPNVFHIQYYSHGTENLWMNKIGRCALMDLDVDYAAAGTSSFLREQQGQGSPPSDTVIRMTFLELDILTRESVDAGY